MSMKAESWRPKASERKRALAAAARALRGGALGPGSLAVEAAVTLARLERMRLAAEITRLVRRVPGRATLAQTALAAFDFVALDAAALAFGVAASELTGRGPEARQARVQVMRALAVRDRADLVVAGAGILLGRPPALDEETQTLLDEFDGVVQPMLYLAIPLNQARLAALAAVAPAERARLWWYARGADLAPTALDALAEAAEILHCFPEAATEIEDLRQAESGLQRLLRHTAAGESQQGAVTTAVAEQVPERVGQLAPRVAVRLRERTVGGSRHR